MLRFALEQMVVWHLLPQVKSQLCRMLHLLFAITVMDVSSLKTYMVRVSFRTSALSRKANEILWYDILFGLCSGTLCLSLVCTCNNNKYTCFCLKQMSCCFLLKLLLWFGKLLGKNLSSFLPVFVALLAHNGPKGKYLFLWGRKIMIGIVNQKLLNLFNFLLENLSSCVPINSFNSFSFIFNRGPLTVYNESATTRTFDYIR